MLSFNTLCRPANARDPARRYKEGKNIRDRYNRVGCLICACQDRRREDSADSSKEGGLHHFLEFCKGETFSVTIRVLNPMASDLGIISVWRREINDGMLRFGALASMGRGRVRVDDDLNANGKTSYQLWINPGAPAITGLEHFQKAASANADEALAGLWDAYTLSPDRLDRFEQYLR